MRFYIKSRLSDHKLVKADKGIVTQNQHNEGFYYTPVDCRAKIRGFELFHKTTVDRSILGSLEVDGDE